MDVLCFAEPFRFDLRSMRRFAESRNALVLVAEIDDVETARPRIAGFVIVHVERSPKGGRRGYVVTLDVLPERRREGIAAALMAGVERLAAEAGAERMELHVFTGNDAAIRFYERLGYERTGVQAGFYGESGDDTLDAFVYGKRLGPGVDGP